MEMEYLNSFGTVLRSKLPVAPVQLVIGKPVSRVLVRVLTTGSVVLHQQIVQLVRQHAVQVVVNAQAAVVEVQLVIGKPVSRVLVRVLTTGSVAWHQRIAQLKRRHAVQVVANALTAKMYDSKNNLRLTRLKCLRCAK
jgi:MOSC domain-containing protein YiiM